MPDKVKLVCQDRYYGIELICYDNGNKKKYFAYHENPFIQTNSNRDCDTVTIRYGDDGDWEVISARAKRYWFDTVDDRWERISNLSPDPNGILKEPSAYGQNGSTYKIVWDKNWPDDFWLSAYNLGEKKPLRRTTFEITLRHPTNSSITKTVYLEITPSKVDLKEAEKKMTYGIFLRCLSHSGNTIGSYHLEAKEGLIQEKAFIIANSDRSCDRIELYANTGHGNQVQKARVTRYYYSNGKWRKANVSAPWYPNKNKTKNGFGLSGNAKYFVWDEFNANSHVGWPNNYWVAKDGMETSSDIKTVIDLLDSNNIVVRSIEVVPNKL
jgi:hypothetical protein